MDRRTFLASVAAAVATGLAGCGAAAMPGQSPEAAAGAARSGARFTPPTGLAKAPLPHGTLFRLPGHTKTVALTVDDGTNEAVIEGYAKLARDTGLRLTFFCNGVNSGWTSHADLLRPLHDDNQIFIANHTWSHHDLLRLSPAEVADQVRRNESFLHRTYGTLGRPFMRPPYGSHDHALDAQLADLGYPAVTMWLGDLGDSTVQKPQAIVASAKQWLLPGHIVIGHANHLPVTKVYGQLVEIIRARALQPVHLGDVFAV
jgi:peptidoglycan/xylan/chitin deacetylase (PgdA/CDA1 family)